MVAKKTRELAGVPIVRCNTLQHTATHCNTLQHTATHCNTLQSTAAHCDTLQHTATHCKALQHIATHCNTLHTMQHPATHCNKLQHIVTHYSTLHNTGIRPTQSMIYVPLLVNRFQKSVLLFVQYKQLKSCSGDLILQNVILRTRSCGTGVITEPSWLLHFHRPKWSGGNILYHWGTSTKGHLGGTSP